MRTKSLQTSILSVVAISLFALTTFLICGITRNEVTRSNANTDRLVLEQISLIVKKLDNLSVLGQVDAISRTIMQLESVEAMAMFDHDCRLLRKQPLNFDVQWRCENKLTPEGTILYRVTNSYADSDGTPTYILAKVKYPKYEFWSIENLTPLIVAVISILATMLILLWLIRRKILTPLGRVRDLVSQPGTLTNSSLISELPLELRPIVESVLVRDEVIQSARREVVQQAKAQVTAEISKQVAHDIKFPLMILRDKIASWDESADANLKYYADALKDLEEITGQLMLNSEDYLTDVDLGAELTEVVAAKKIEFKGHPHTRDISIDFIDASERAVIRVNRSKLRRVVSNLINNAKEAITFGSHGQIVINLEKIDGHGIMSIRDNGRGIQPENLERIFRRGISIHKPGGSGLGLSDAKEAIERVGGNISVTSQFRLGTTVRIEFPIVKADYASVGSPPFAKVLIEDHKLSQLIWLDEAKQHGFDFVVFKSPRDFLTHRHLMAKSAEIYIDSQFPDFDEPGELWAESLQELGFDNLWLCSTSEIRIDDKPWFKGTLKKTTPFGHDLIPMPLPQKNIRLHPRQSDDNLIRFTDVSL